MLKQTRHDQILQLVKEKGSVETSELCRLFGITEMTARRDLDALSGQGTIIRTHGGAMLSAEEVNVERPFNTRLSLHKDAKETIAKAALAYVKDGQNLFFNSSSTVLSLVRLIDNSRQLLIATDTIRIADELNTRSRVTVIQIGGELKKNTLASSGYWAETMIRQFHFDTAILGVKAIDADGNLYCSNLLDRGIYDAVFASTNEIILIADSSKLGQTDFVRFGSLQDVDRLITDKGAPTDLLIAFKEKGFTIELA
ncbi:MAG: DeoR/GlpR family DNA-binding transcription regulator [Eubacteriales bacterium]|nr:DeoR/GlpR family DNA-binding transcription regulator [Eubacteriales bacterium]